jgi:hypothetical protein
MGNLTRRLFVVENALLQNEHPESTERIIDCAKCVSLDDAGLLSLYPNRCLVTTALELDTIRGSSVWKKVLETDELKDKVMRIVDKIDQETKKFSVRIVVGHIGMRVLIIFQIAISLAIERDTKDIIQRLIVRMLYVVDVGLGFTRAVEKRSQELAPRALRLLQERHRQMRPSAWRVHGGNSGRYLGTHLQLGGRRFILSYSLAQWAGRHGKSTLAYTVCRHFNSDDRPARLCASFFCSRQVEDLRRLGNVIPTIAYQLARLSSSFAKCLGNVDADAVHISSEQMETLLVGPWKQTVKDRSDELPLYLIVIDALDEIDDDGGETLLRELISATMTAKGGIRGLKVLVTSRPHPKIVAATDLLSRDTVYRLEDIKEGQEDVRKYLAEALPELEKSRKRGLDDLSDLANGLFIFAATAARLISPPEHTLSTKRQANLLSAALQGRHLISSGGKSMVGIDTLYAQAIRDAIPEDDHAAYLSILHNIICTLQPLPVSVHADLLATNSEDKDEEAVEHFVRALYAVLYIRDGRVYTHHKSFSDSVVDAQRCGHQLVCIPSVQHALIAHGCFRIMEGSLRFNICSLPSSFLLDSEVRNLEHTVDETVHGNLGLEYACRYWTSHLVEVPAISSDAQDLQKTLLHFSHETVLFWVEIMNLLSAKETCYDGVTSVVAWVKKAVRHSAAMTIFTADM